MKVTISTQGTLSNGNQWSWVFGRGVRVMRDGGLIMEVKIDGFKFEALGADGDESPVEISQELREVCEKCAGYQDEAVMAFEWCGLIVLHKSKRKTLGRLKKAGNRKEDVIHALSEELMKTACRDARVMMPDSDDSAFEAYESSELIRNTARRMVLKAVA